MEIRMDRHNKLLAEARRDGYSDLAAELDAALTAIRVAQDRYLVAREMIQERSRVARLISIAKGRSPAQLMEALRIYDDIRMGKKL